jgi:hypothetical protein
MRHRVGELEESQPVVDAAEEVAVEYDDEPRQAVDEAAKQEAIRRIDEVADDSPKGREAKRIVAEMPTDSE